MRRLICLLSLSLTIFLTGCTQPAPRPASTTTDHPPLLLISIDAFRADYFQRGKSPTLTKLANNGVHAKWMEPSFPSLTFPNHYTLVTGLYPDHHGIVHNSMYDAKLGRFSLGREKAVSDGRWWSEGEPLWVTADKHGLKTATMFWPGSGAKIHGYRPDYWRPYDGKVTATQRVDQVLAWLDLPADQRPQFLTLYFDAVDHAGHHYGPDTPEVNAAITHVDDAIGRLVQGLKQRGMLRHINIIIVSDHGMAATPVDQQILVDKIIDMDHVYATSMGVLAGFTPKRGHADEVAAKLLKPHPHMTCWRKADIPPRYHYGSNPRIPALDCLADVGWKISTSAWVASHKGRLSRGTHGYDNADPRMRALFIAHGPAFRKGVTVAPFPNVDVYPLMTHLLGIEAQPNDGDFQAVKGMLKTAKQP